MSHLTVIALENATLTCSASVDDVTYSWYRVGGSVLSRSIEQNSNTLIILRVIPFDLGEYYCMAKRKGIAVKSNKAVIKVDGKIFI